VQDSSEFSESTVTLREQILALCQWHWYSLNVGASHNTYSRIHYSGLHPIR